MATAHCSLPESYAAILSIRFLPAGPKLGIHSNASAVLAIDFLPPATAEKAPANPLAVQVVEQLSQYFSHSDFVFTLALETGGTAFQQRVWAAMLAIPSGPDTQLWRTRSPITHRRTRDW